MSAHALEALAEAESAGVKITLDGDGLILEADPLPSGIVALLKTVKPDLLRVIAGREAAKIATNADAAAGLPAAPLGCGPGRPEAVHRRRLGRSGGPLRLDARRALPRAAGLGPGRPHRRGAARRRSPGDRRHRGVNRDRDAFRLAAQVSPDRTGASGMSNGLGAFRVEPANALKPERSLSSHNYRLSAYERKEKDFYPTPAELGTGLALGLRRLGLYLPRVALDPCGGDGALRRSLVPFGVDVRLSDLYPELHAAAGGYLTREPLDASEPKQLRHSLDLAGAGCTAIITNTPHKTVEACAIVENAIGLAEEGRQLDLVAVLFRSIWGAEPGRLLLSQPAVLPRRYSLLLAAPLDRGE